ncbi:MAG: glycosyl transferase [Verrucomicrobia bacterium]|nr:glycosyl transferase [Verrucomicrobiota bacterium]
MPGELHEVPWVDFEHNRSEVLALARKKGTHLLMLNADETLNVRGEWPARIDSDACLLRYEGVLDYQLPLLVRSDLPWRFVGVTHEYLDCPQKVTYGGFPGFTIRHHFDGGMRADKFQRDLRLLTAALEREPGNARHMFYLAQTYRDIGLGYQALQWYERRAEVEPAGEEVWYALYQAAKIRGESCLPWEAVLSAYLKAYEYRPSRLEPLYHVARHYRLRGQFALGWVFARACQAIAYPEDLLFIERDVYHWKLPWEYALCCQGAGQAAEAGRIYDGLLASSILPDTIRESIAELRSKC